MKEDSRRIVPTPRLDRESWGRAIQSITDAFTEDPCLRYLLDSADYDPEKARHIHEYTLRVGARYGHIITTGESCEGVSIWLPPRRVEVSTWMFIRSGGLGLRKTVDPGIIDRLRKYGDYSSAIHHRNAPSPHWYLLSIGVAREARGRGHAKAVMLPMMRHFDTCGEACYLETHNPKNLAFYEKFGFKLVEKGCLPDSEITHYAMLREAKTKEA